MLRNARCAAWLAVALLAAALPWAVSGAVDHGLYREIKSRTEQIDAGISEVASESETTGDEVDVTQVPGRDSFITWGLSAIATLEEEGAIVRDDEFVRKGGANLRPKASSEGNSYTAMLFETLGRLKAEQAIPALAQYVLTNRGIAHRGLHMGLGEAFPACGALAAIGKGSLPVMLSNIKEKDYQRILKNSAWVIGTVLGEAAPAYLDDQIRLERDASVKKKLESVRRTVMECASEAKGERLDKEKLEKAKAAHKERELKREVFE